LTTVVLDAAHGGNDSGARGAGGNIEKDITLALARLVKSQFEARGLRVVLTREGDRNPSPDERAALANARNGAIFVSLHVGSTGAPGTARVYYFSAPSTTPTTDAEKSTWVRWDEAQYRFLEQSAQLAGLVQVQIGLKLRGSPEVAIGAPVRQLRTVHAPAIAVELSSVSVADRKILDAAMEPLADAIARGALAFQPVYAAGGR
jgi:N-acetylmuramoyl-L-alanine amidase